MGGIECRVEPAGGAGAFTDALCAAVREHLAIGTDGRGRLSLNIRVLSETAFEAFFAENGVAVTAPLAFEVVDTALSPEMAVEYAQDLVFHLNAQPSTGSGQ